MVGWSLVLMDRSYYEIRYTCLKSFEPNFLFMRKINIIVSQTTLCSCRPLSLFIQHWGLVYHSCMVEKLSFILADMTSLLQPHMNSSSLYIIFIFAAAAMRNAQKCSLLGSILVEGNVYFYQPRNGSI